MDEHTGNRATIWVITGGSIATTRGSGTKQLKIEELSVNVNLFLEQIGNILEQTPEKLGRFHLDEFEVHAEVTAQGTLAVLGTGIQAGAAGELRFVFRRTSASGEATR